MGLLEEDRLQVEPVWTFLLTRRFEILSPAGDRLGEIAGGSTELELRDAGGVICGYFYRPWRFFRVRIEIADESGTKHGTIVQVTPLGRIRFEIQDPAGEVIGALSPTKSWAMKFDLVDLSGVRKATIERRYRFWRTGSYAIDLVAGADVGTRLIALAGVVAIDKEIDGRRASSVASSA